MNYSKILSGSLSCISFLNIRFPWHESCHTHCLVPSPCVPVRYSILYTTDTGFLVPNIYNTGTAYPWPKGRTDRLLQNKQQSMSTTCTGICIKMHNYSKPCNCKHYFITCVSKGANINKYRNCFTRANHCSCWEPIINIRHAQLLKDGTKKSLVKCYRCTHLV